MKPILSVIMPTFNRGGNFLYKSITSLLRQDFTDFELIVIDDCSSDETTAIVDDFKDSRIKYYRNSKNKGEYWSTNFAIEKANSRYLTWLHSDDELPPLSLSSRIKLLNDRSELDFVHGDITKIDSEGKLLQHIKATDSVGKEVFNDYLQNLRDGNMIYRIHHLSIMMKREFMNKTGFFDTTLPFAGDIDWLLRALKIGVFLRIKRNLYQYRTHSQTRRITDINNGVDKVGIHKKIASRYNFI